MMRREEVTGILLTLIELITDTGGRYYASFDQKIEIKKKTGRNWAGEGKEV